MSQTADVVVMGAGIAGSSLAYELADRARVILLERESMPGYHSTGRSAAMLSETYGSDAVQRLAGASRSFLARPPEDFADTPILSPRGMLQVARADQLAVLDEAERSLRPMVPSLRRLTKDEVLAAAPLVDPGYVEAGLLEPDAMAIDVTALHQGFIRGLRRRGGEFVTYAHTKHIAPIPAGWQIETAAGTFIASLLVNAAGAWADQVAILAGVATIGLVPKRRTAILLEPPDGMDSSAWPMVNDIDEQFYVKPESRGLMVSPADETPAVPADVQPEELDIAIAVDRYQTLTGREVRKISHSWAGLRSFVGDHNPVIGFDAEAPDFFWLAAQGGFGIMTSPAIARLASSMILRESPPDDLADLIPQISPARVTKASHRPAGV